MKKINKDVNIEDLSKMSKLARSTLLLDVRLAIEPDLYPQLARPLLSKFHDGLLMDLLEEFSDASEKDIQTEGMPMTISHEVT
jgi:hypothetical protein